MVVIPMASKHMKSIQYHYSPLKWILGRHKEILIYVHYSGSKLKDWQYQILANCIELLQHLMRIQNGKYLEKTFGPFLALNRLFEILLFYCRKSEKHWLQKDLYKHVNYSSIFDRQKLETVQCLSTGEWIKKCSNYKMEI